MRKALHRIKGLLRGRDRGTVAVTFILALPILLLVIAILVQYALLANGRLTFERALASAARSAVTALPADPDVDFIDGRSKVERAARLALTAIAPPAASTSSEARALAEAMAGVGVTVPADFAGRYTFAENGAVVKIEVLDRNGNVVPARDASGTLMDAPANFARVAGARVRITMHFPFRLNVPVANTLIGEKTTISGLGGRYHTYSGHVDVQLSDGRIVPTDLQGEPVGTGRPQ